MEQVLYGLEGVGVYIDDLLVTGDSIEAHLNNMEMSLRDYRNMALNCKKGSVVSFSPLLSSWGSALMLKPDKEFMSIQPRWNSIITKCSQQETVSQIQSFLGMVQYHSRFIPHLSTLLHPLTRLLQKEACWNWTAQCEEAVTAVKQQLTGATVLTTYNPDLQLRLATDASAYDVGAVI